jgi:hypothetical protein
MIKTIKEPNLLFVVALKAEAQALIEFYSLTCTQKTPLVYKNDNITLIVAGICLDGMDMFWTLTDIFQNISKFSKVINVGICGCDNKDVNVGTLFSTNKKLDGIDFAKCITKDTAVVQKNTDDDAENFVLYDMEQSYFLEIMDCFFKKDDIFVFKIVSDHLEGDDISKDEAKGLILSSISKWEKFIIRQWSDD